MSSSESDGYQSAEDTPGGLEDRKNRFVLRKHSEEKNAEFRAHSHKKRADVGVSLRKTGNNKDITLPQALEKIRKEESSMLANKNARGSVTVNDSNKSESVDELPSKSDSSLEGWDVDDEENFIVNSESPQDDLRNLEITKTQERNQTEGGWAVPWGGWGVSSLLSSATESVSTLTTHVSSGLTSVFETSLGVPQPEELVKQLEKETLSTEPIPEPVNKQSDDSASFGLGNIFSGVSQLGNKVICGGLDTLETLGKKTMEVLQDGDPGLKKKRALFFKNENTKLSQLLREAQQMAEIKEGDRQDQLNANRPNFETLFDDSNGLMHLQALEMISKQCSLKLHSKLMNFTSSEMTNKKRDMGEIQELFDLYELDDIVTSKSSSSFIEKIESALVQMEINLPLTKITEMDSKLEYKLKSGQDLCKERNMNMIHHEVLFDMAQFTGLAMEIYHMVAIRLLSKTDRLPAVEADGLMELTKGLCGRLTDIAEAYGSIITKIATDSECQIVTDIYIETANGCSYLQNAYQMFIPIVQEALL